MDEKSGIFIAEETRKRLLLLLDPQAEVKTRLAATAETIPDDYIVVHGCWPTSSAML